MPPTRAGDCLLPAAGPIDVANSANRQPAARSASGERGRRLGCRWRRARPASNPALAAGGDSGRLCLHRRIWIARGHPEALPGPSGHVRRTRAADGLELAPYDQSRIDSGSGGVYYFRSSKCLRHRDHEPPAPYRALESEDYSGRSWRSWCPTPGGSSAPRWSSRADGSESRPTVFGSPGSMRPAP